MTRPTIAVVGAGIGGLAAAAMLHRRGFDVRVYEQAKRFARIGAEPQPGTPAEYAAMMRGEIAKWAAVVRQAGIRME